MGWSRYLPCFLYVVFHLSYPPPPHFVVLPLSQGEKVVSVYFDFYTHLLILFSLCPNYFTNLFAYSFRELEDILVFIPKSGDAMFFI